MLSHHSKINDCGSDWKFFLALFLSLASGDYFHHRGCWEWPLIYSHVPDMNSMQDKACGMSYTTQWIDQSWCCIPSQWIHYTVWSYKVNVSRGELLLKTSIQHDLLVCLPCHYLNWQRLKLNGRKLNAIIDRLYGSCMPVYEPLLVYNDLDFDMLKNHLGV